MRATSFRGRFLELCRFLGYGGEGRAAQGLARQAAHGRAAAPAFGHGRPIAGEPGRPGKRTESPESAIRRFAFLSTCFAWGCF